MKNIHAIFNKYVFKQLPCEKNSCVCFFYINLQFPLLGVFDEINLIYKVYCNDPRAEIVCKPKRVLKYHLFESLITDGWLDDTVSNYELKIRHCCHYIRVHTFQYIRVKFYTVTSSVISS